ncbi:MAG: MoaD/ThiS family protein [Candidatus Tectomicrobia bacterium]|uniref:MoaD/ThiS family protein n=1 Tax=Tectimicrobiota bacterium TaxID=2528274 RepID=A0A937W3H2_UNCTE|nr:MoaD/ThiS family protein [Candidatus Tectomicrobia bacterium]
MAEVWLPTYMQSLTGGLQRVQAGGHTVGQLIDDLEKQYPGLKERLYDEEEDNLMPGLAVVVDGDASLIGLLEQVREDSEVHFLPAIGGG